MSARCTRLTLASLVLAGAAIVLAPQPGTLRADEPVRRLAVPLDPGLRLSFPSLLLRSPPAGALAPGDRVLGVQLDGDAGLLAPRDRDALLGVAARAPGAALTLEVRGARGVRREPAVIVSALPRAALAEQWPVAVSGLALLAFAAACGLGARHPSAVPLAAFTGCLGVGVLASLDGVLPADRGLLGMPTARARLGLLAWTLLPAALLHLAMRFPVVVPRFRRRGLAALPYALWSVPATLAQVRFDEPARVHTLECLALAATFLGGAVLVLRCVRPAAAPTPVERARARAVIAGLVAGGGGPLAAFVAGAPLRPLASTGIALGTLAIPLAFGWATSRYGLLAAPVLPLPQRLRIGLGRRRAAEALLARAARELAGASDPEQVRARLAVLLAEGLRASDVEVGALEPPDSDGALLRRARVLWGAADGAARATLLRRPRSEDPRAGEPELVVTVEPRSGPAWLVAIGPRRDARPYTREERRAVEDVARLAALACGDAIEAAALEACVVSRTEALARALADRSALVAAAARVQQAADPTAVRAAVVGFLSDRTGRPVRALTGRQAPATTVACPLRRSPSSAEGLGCDGVDPARAADLQPQADTLAALATLALERLHLLHALKREVARQAEELASVRSGRRHAEFVRRAAHELRKPTEEIRHLVAPLGARATAADRAALARIEAAAHELARRLDCLLSREGLRCDVRRVDLVRLADDAVRRVSLGGHDPRFGTAHAAPRVPLLGDPVRLVSLAENLLDNARKAAGPHGRIEVGAALERLGADPWAILEVRDDGPGLPADLGEDVFEPGVGRFREGFGLGLAFCRDVAALHGGFLEFESEPGRTVFRVLLPQLGPAVATPTLRLTRAAP